MRSEELPMSRPVTRLQRLWLIMISAYFLLVFPLVTIIQPISVRMAINRSGVPADAPEIRQAVRVLYTDTFIRLVLSIFTIWTGILMWTRRWRVLLVMKWCLMLLIAYNTSFYPFLSLINGGSIGVLVSGMLQRVFHTPVLFAGISYIYFRNRN